METLLIARFEQIPKNREEIIEESKKIIVNNFFTENITVEERIGSWDLLISAACAGGVFLGVGLLNFIYKKFLDKAWEKTAMAIQNSQNAPEASEVVADIIPTNLTENEKSLKSAEKSQETEVQHDKTGNAEDLIEFFKKYQKSGLISVSLAAPLSSNQYASISVYREAGLGNNIEDNKFNIVLGLHANEIETRNFIFNNNFGTISEDKKD